MSDACKVALAVAGAAAVAVASPVDRSFGPTAAAGGVYMGANTTPAPAGNATAAPSAVGTLKGAVQAGAWIPFAVVVGVSLMFSTSYIWFFQHKRKKELPSTLTSILGLTVALLTIALVPIDIFLVTSMKNANGEFQDWATETVVDNSKTLATDAYYAFYALNLALAFVFMPLAYFYYEEKDEEMNVGPAKRCLGACKYTFVLLLVLVILLCIGAFAFTNDGSADCLDTFNATNYKEYVSCRAEYAEKSLASDGGNNALSFTLGILVVIGYIWFGTYTAYGMVSLPIDMIRTRGRTATTDEEVADKHQQISSQRDAIENRYSRKGGKGRKKMSGRHKKQLLDMKEQERVINRAQRKVKQQQSACCGKFGRVCRPFEWLFGFLFLLLSLFFAVCLLMSSADKLMQIRQQDPPDYKHGYTNTTARIANPLDLILTKTHAIFPMDYIIITLTVYYFAVATMNGISKIQPRFCWLKVGDAGERRPIKIAGSAPQPLLFMILILLFVILAFNVVLLTLAPTYVTYGDQVYPSLPDSTTAIVDGVPQRSCDAVATFPGSTTQCGADAPGALYMVRVKETGATFHTDFRQLIPRIKDGETMVRKFADKWGDCDEDTLQWMVQEPQNPLCGHGDDKMTLAGYLNLTVDNYNRGVLECKQRNDPCNQTRLAAILHAFFYKAWFLGAIYYWANWLFLLIFFFTFVVLTIKKRASIMQVALNDVSGDFDDSDDELLGDFKPSALFRR